MTFKEKLVILRKGKGLTQDEFAAAVGVSRQAVYKWECGQSYPEVPKLLEMKLLFTISIDELLDDNTPSLRENKGKPLVEARGEVTPTQQKTTVSTSTLYGNTTKSLFDTKPRTKSVRSNFKK